MKKFKQLVMAFLVGVVSFGFTACSDENNEEKFELPEVGQATVNVSSSDKEMQKVAKVYVNQVVYPTYQALAANARTLYTTTAALYTAAESGTMTQAQIDAACEAFKDTRREWERSEAFLYGSASDNELDPHIDSWPLDHEELVNALKNPTLVAGFKSSDPAKFVSENNSKFQSVLGFHGMEFVLFREGKNRTVSRRAQHHRTSRVHMDGQRSKQRDKERAQQRKLRVLIAPLQRTGSQRHNVLRSVPAFSVCNNGLQLMAEHSLLNLLKTMNYSGLNDLTAALNNAIQALETAKNSGKSFVEAPGAQHVKDCIDAVSALDEELNKAGDWVNKQDAL